MGDERSRDFKGWEDLAEHYDLKGNSRGDERQDISSGGNVWNLVRKEVLVRKEKREAMSRILPRAHSPEPPCTAKFPASRDQQRQLKSSSSSGQC